MSKAGIVEIKLVELEKWVSWLQNALEPKVAFMNCVNQGASPAQLYQEMSRLAHIEKNTTILSVKKEIQERMANIPAELP